MKDIGNAAIAGAAAGAVLELGWIGVISLALLNAALAARRRYG